MATRLIKIDELRTGMFLAEIDISWRKSPFFRHKRLITKQDDIDLLKAAGVQKCKIDLAKSELSETEINTKRKKNTVKNTPAKTPLSNTKDEPEETKKEIVSESSQVQKEPKNPNQPIQPKETKVTLKQELKAALNLRKNVIAAVDKINKSVEAGNPIKLDDISPIVDNTMKSLERNDQALITLLHQSREHTKLASHTFGVFTLVMLICSKINTDDNTIDELGVAALLHDAGWSKLPNNLLGKGKPYSTNEKKLVSQHLPILAKTLDASEFVSPRVKKTILQHHELCDGSGYPKKLKGDEIDPWAKILAVCDKYDEMVHGLCELPGLTPPKALSDLYHLAQATKYDHEITALLIRIMGVYPLGSAVLVSTGEKGIVTEMNRNDTLRPRIHLFYDANGQVMLKPKVIDLTNPDCIKNNLKIAKVLNNSDPDVDPKKLLILNPELI